ncbi:MAG: thioesterase family protein [Planctomycetaceae bacterium]|nr:thioesterase family protein [Planctomycetaceae bacterium]
MDLPKIGTSHETTFIVEPQHAIPFPDLPPVLATPWIVWHLEATAYYMLQPTLPEGHITVGTHIELDHLAPALVGADISCRCKVVNVDGNVITLHVEALEGSETLSKGLHKRHVVDVIRFARRLEGKILTDSGPVTPLPPTKDEADT